MGKKLSVEITHEECRALLQILTTLSLNMFDNSIDTKAVISILQEFVKKLQSSMFSNKSIKSLKVHEAWALYKALGNADLNHESNPYETNLVNRITNTIHQKLT